MNSKKESFKKLIFQLSKKAKDVHTNKGILDLPEGTFIGGHPKKFLILIKKIKLETTKGLIEFKSGTKINCDHGPGQPDPCGGT